MLGSDSSFGQLTTSRNEGANAGLKAWIETTSGDLVTFESCLDWWSDLHSKFVAQRAKESDESLTNLTGPFWDGVTRRIYHYPLKKVYKACKAAEDAIKAGHTSNCNCGDSSKVCPGICTGRERRVYGLPCKHALIRLLQDNKDLQMKHFDQY